MNKPTYRAARRLLRDNGRYALRWLPADVAAVTVGSDTYLFYDDHGAGGTIDAAIKLDHIAASGLHLTDFA